MSLWFILEHYDTKYSFNFLSTPYHHTALMVYIKTPYTRLSWDRPPVNLSCTALLVLLRPM